MLSVLRKPFRAWGPALVMSVVLVAAAAVVVAALRGSPAAPPRPVLVASGSWAPFVGPDLADGGPVARIVTETLRRSGYTPEISYTTWPLAEERVDSGASVGVFPLVGSAGRREKFLLSNRLVDFEYGLFYHRGAGEPRITAAADLAKLRVGSVAGYDYWKELESAVGDFVEYKSTLDGLRALAHGDVDILAEGLLSGRAALADPSFEGDAADFAYIRGESPLVHSVEGLYFMMADTPEATDVMRQFNTELTKFKQSDDYRRLVAALTPSESAEVTLEPVGTTGLVELLDANGSVVLLAPRGTRAKVLAWPTEFTGVDAGPPARSLVKVKITNGPAQGRMLYVDARAVVLEVAGS